MNLTEIENKCQLINLNMCKAITKKGEQCKKKTKADYCKIHHKKQDVSNEICSICYSQVATNTRLDCKHAFCNTCIKAWLKINPSCPMCRQNINESKLKEFGIQQQHVFEFIVPIERIDELIRILNLTGVNFKITEIRMLE
jgi:hypothetical protein